MTPDEFAHEVDRVVDALDLGTPSAVKRGRNPDFPYVPIIKHGERTENPMKGFAYATREEAVAAAEHHLAALREATKVKVKTTRYRALREHHGLPRELPS